MKKLLSLILIVGLLAISCGALAEADQPGYIKHSDVL